MDSELLPSTTLVLHSACRVQRDELRHTFTLICPGGVLMLSYVAGDALLRCNGRDPLIEILAAVRRLRPGSEDEVVEFLSAAYRKGWVVDASERT